MLDLELLSVFSAQLLCWFLPAAAELAVVLLPELSALVLPLLLMRCPAALPAVLPSWLELLLSPSKGPPWGPWLTSAWLPFVSLGHARRVLAFAFASACLCVRVRVCVCVCASVCVFLFARMSSPPWLSLRKNMSQVQRANHAAKRWPSDTTKTHTHPWCNDRQPLSLPGAEARAASVSNEQGGSTGLRLDSVRNGLGKKRENECKVALLIGRHLFC